MVKDGLIDKAEHKRKKTEALSQSLGLAMPGTGDAQAPSGSSVDGGAGAGAGVAGGPSVASTHASGGSAPPAPQLRFNTRREDQGPVQRLTPRSGSKLVKYFDDAGAQQ